MWRVIVSFAIIIIIVISASVVSDRLWSGEKEQQPDSIKVQIINDMTVSQFGQKYSLSRPVLKEIFNLTSPTDLKKRSLILE